MICWLVQLSGPLNYVDCHIPKLFLDLDIFVRMILLLLFKTLLRCIEINSFVFVQINSSKFKDISICVVLTNV